jgi:hypothetical protein
LASTLLSISKASCINAAQDAAELVAKLRAYHNLSQTQKDKEQLKWFGLETRSKMEDEVTLSASVYQPLANFINYLAKTSTPQFQFFQQEVYPAYFPIYCVLSKFYYNWIF